MGSEPSAQGALAIAADVSFAARERDALWLDLDAHVRRGTVPVAVCVPVEGASALDREVRLSHGSTWLGSELSI